MKKKHTYYFTRVDSMLTFIEWCLKDDDDYKSIKIVRLSDLNIDCIDDAYRVELIDK